MSVLWTEADFQRVALSTKLSQRSVEACRSVLVDGLSGVQAAALHKVFPAQISRSLGTLRERHGEMVRSAEAFKDDTAVLRFTAGQVAKSMLGDSLVVEDAQPGKQYDGPVVANIHGFLVQKVGRNGIIHDLGDLDRLPSLNTPLTIVYPNDTRKGTIVQPEHQQTKAKELDR